MRILALLALIACNGETTDPETDPGSDTSSDTGSDTELPPIGSEWASVPLPEDTVHPVALLGTSGDNVLAASAMAQQAYVSADGATWTMVDLPAYDGRSLTYDMQTVLYSGEDAYMSNNDGSWDMISSPESGQDWVDMVVVDDTLVALMNGSVYAYDDAGDSWGPITINGTATAVNEADGDLWVTGCRNGVGAAWEVKDTTNTWDFPQAMGCGTTLDTAVYDYFLYKDYVMVGANHRTYGRSLNGDWVLVERSPLDAWDGIFMWPDGTRMTDATMNLFKPTADDRVVISDTLPGAFITSAVADELIIQIDERLVTDEGNDYPPADPSGTPLFNELVGNGDRLFAATGEEVRVNAGDWTELERGGSVGTWGRRGILTADRLGAAHYETSGNQLGEYELQTTLSERGFAAGEEDVALVAFKAQCADGACTGGGIFRAVDDEEETLTFERSESGLPSNSQLGLGTGGNPSVSLFAFSGSGAYALLGNRVYSSTDLGETWNSMAAIAINVDGSPVDLEPTSLAASDSAVYATSFGGLSASTDTESWNWVELSTTETPERVFVTEGRVWVAGGDWLIMSEDGGDTWEDFDAPGPVHGLTDFDGDIFATAYGRMWELR